MPLNQNTIPQVLYDTPDPHSEPSELYKINGVILESATDPIKRWVVKEEHGYWDEATKTFKNRAVTLLPNEPQHCFSVQQIHDEVEKQVMARVAQGFKYQMEWDPMAPPPYFYKYEISADGTRKQYT